MQAFDWIGDISNVLLAKIQRNRKKDRDEFVLGRNHNSKLYHGILDKLRIDLRGLFDRLALQCISVDLSVLVWLEYLLKEIRPKRPHVEALDVGGSTGLVDVKVS